MISNPENDTKLAKIAGKVIIDGRDPRDDFASILVTAEHVMAVILILTMGGNVRKAARMLNEGFLQGVEERLALYAKGEINL